MNIDFLDYFHYNEPKIVEYHKDNVDVVIRDGELGEKEAVLLVDGNQWTAHEIPGILSLLVCKRSYHLYRAWFWCERKLVTQ